MRKDTKDKSDKGCTNKINQLEKKENQSCTKKLHAKVLIQTTLIKLHKFKKKCFFELI